jgi:hypothetical protein
MGFGLVIEFIVLLQLVTKSKNYALAVLHTSQITIGHARSSQSVSVFTSHCMMVASSGGHSPSSEFSNCPWPQLPPSPSKQLTTTEPQRLSNSPTVKVKVTL